MTQRSTLAICGVLLLWNYSTAALAQSEHDFSKWEKAIAAFEQHDQESPPPKHEVLFTGSSTIARWKSLEADFPDYKVINRGFGGSEILDCTHFADRMIFPYAPRMIVLRSGSNDLHAGKTPEQVFADFKQFATCIRERLPDTEIVCLSQFPTIARLGQRDQEQVLNKLVAEFADGTPHVKYLDVSTVVLGADGQPRAELFVEDKLHLNADGYKLLAERIRPCLSADK